MPAQSTTPATAYYSEGDTAPALARQLLDGDGNAIDLTNASKVEIRIAHARYSHYYSPYEPIVDFDAASNPCSIDDAVNGWVSWSPDAGDLSPAGSYHYVFKITYSDATEETVPNNTYETLIVRTKPGGSV